MEYLEVVEKGRPLSNPGVPLVAIPTTTGTGTEATRNALLGVAEHGVKVSLRSQHHLLRVAVVDPDLSLSLTPEVTASTGMDALTQLVEPFVSNAATSFTDGVCREGLTRSARSLTIAYRDRADFATREDMALAAHFSGVALTNARLGAVHGFAGVLGGSTGFLCARLPTFVMEANIRAIANRGDPSILQRDTEIARTLTGDSSVDARAGVTWVREICAELQIPPLREAGLCVADCSRLILLVRRASSMKGNPVTLCDEELIEILEAAI